MLDWKNNKRASDCDRLVAKNFMEMIWRYLNIWIIRIHQIQIFITSVCEKTTLFYAECFEHKWATIKGIKGIQKICFITPKKIQVCKNCALTSPVI